MIPPDAGPDTFSRNNLAPRLPGPLYNSYGSDIPDLFASERAVHGRICLSRVAPLARQRLLVDKLIGEPLVLSRRLIHFSRIN